MFSAHVYPFFNLVGRNEAARQEAQPNPATPPRDVDEGEPATTSGKVSYTTASGNVDVGQHYFNTCFGPTFQELIVLGRDWIPIVPSSSSQRCCHAGPKWKTSVLPTVKFGTKQKRWNAS